MSNNNQQKNLQSQPHLGLVCITTSKQVRYRTITRKRLLQMTLEEQAERLHALYTENLARLNLAIDFCLDNAINLYRMTSGLFPFADTEMGAEILTEFTDELQTTGNRATENKLRLVLHPDQFVVLSSDRPQVIENSIKILAMHARIMDLLAQPKSPWALLNIHGGKSDRAEKLIATIRALPDNIRSRLTLENDEYAYSSEDILAVCREAKIPMVFDAHHHIVNQKLDSYDHESVAEMLAAARTTWANPEHQLVHISNGKEAFGDQRHSDLITNMPSSYKNAPWIEVEAKLKEEAIFKLREEWLPKLSNRELVTA
ncbi:MAG: UV DNA damage repair endonuclease UvsE [Oscillatoria sp. PMC 1068.18]|nr:UV DNA damage repair endonuclease UvsE [Oscillatoria sp. PMC 1076.18]MEC4989346.1 UV DNA damage repair endonuclease UvsE [Oscillatoria sp. PMC 1068.18]